ncbi:hypothetical protein ACJX0J_035389 [Zea mays]
MPVYCLREWDFKHDPLAGLHYVVWFGLELLLEQFDRLPSYHVNMVAGTQINKDNPEPDDDEPEQEMGTFKKATEEILSVIAFLRMLRHDNDMILDELSLATTR